MTSPLLVTWYGDDFTGSTDVLEALALAGLRAVLFLRPPDVETLRRFGDLDAVGLAGASRSESSVGMEVGLRASLTWLKALEAPVCHYKICSTFDSSPEIGSIGKAIDLGAEIFRQRVTPLVVGAPQLRRYTAFGNHFATLAGEPYRLDRHPVMRRHPTTPMAEADLRLHLGEQTQKRVGLADLVTLKAEDVEARIDTLMSGDSEVLLFDVIDDETQLAVGRAIRRLQREDGLFVVGSSGIEYALMGAWRELGLIDELTHFPSPGPVDRVAVVSGSCSEVTGRQIEHAIEAGFAGIALDVDRLLSADVQTCVNECIESGLRRLADGRSVIIYTALGPTVAGPPLPEASRSEIGRRLGHILRELVERAGLKRVVIAGGDTSSHALEALEVIGLSVLMPLPDTPGSPLCNAHGPDGAVRFQVSLKGGQIGADDYFSTIKSGRA